VKHQVAVKLEQKKGAKKRGRIYSPRAASPDQAFGAASQKTGGELNKSVPLLSPLFKFEPDCYTLAIVDHHKQEKP
jgi:hypothetical protein